MKNYHKSCGRVGSGSVPYFKSYFKNLYPCSLIFAKLVLTESVTVLLINLFGIQLAIATTKDK